MPCSACNRCGWCVIYVGDSALFANFAARFTVAGDMPYSVAMRSAVLLGGATGSN